MGVWVCVCVCVWGGVSNLSEGYPLAKAFLEVGLVSAPQSSVSLL